VQVALKLFKAEDFVGSPARFNLKRAALPATK
jgi:hypothetical protein